MPVRTRSQIKAKRSETEIEGQPKEHRNTKPNSAKKEGVVLRRSPRKNKGISSTNQKLTPNVTQSSKKERSLSASVQSQHSEEEKDIMEGHHSNNNNSEVVNGFRHYVKNYLETPQKMNPRYVPSPQRVSSISIKNKHMSKPMEFLIPPHVNDDPSDVRKKIIEEIMESEKPMMNGLHRKPVFDENTRLWSPYPPSFDQKRADEKETLLTVLIISILLAVGCIIYHNEMKEFFMSEFLPMIQNSINVMLSYFSAIWKEILNVVNMVVVNKSNDISNGNMMNATNPTNATNATVDSSLNSQQPVMPNEEVLTS